ncbi:MAG: CHAT domain-containing protein, partial [Actinomycetota bacterium]|nr:CHAT domain-containing protein [Actinomycetota bacterium]
PHAAGEAEAIARVYGDAVHLHGAAAHVGAVKTALGRCDRAHLACHGSFRADNPLFSALTLADGPLTVHDLESLDAAPRQIILSACDSGRSAVRAGDELMGMTSALLAIGADVVIASTVPVPDEQTKPLMIELHRRLRQGDAPAPALCSARAAVKTGDHAGAVAADAFLAFGAG